MTIQVDDDQMQAVASYVRAVSGIVLSPSKGYLVETRLRPLLDEHELESFGALIERAESDPSGVLRGAIIDAISTQETSFFRDDKPFRFLADYFVPRHVARNKRLDVWCAAASTGQEIYSLAMILEEVLDDLDRYDIRILGTDISEAALTYCSQARYSRLEVSRGVSAERLRRHFSKEGKTWKLNDELRALIAFRQLNLMEPLGEIGPFDLILCRNVAIYFSIEDRRKLFDRISERLRPEGVLLVGSTESLAGVTDRLERREHGGVVYYVRAG